MRRNILIFVLILVAVTVAAFLLVYRPQSQNITEAREEADVAEQDVQRLRLELARREALREQAAELRAEAVRLDAAMPTDDPQLARLILQLQESADASGIEWISVSPSLPAAVEGNPGVLEINLSLNVQGGYFQVQDYITRLENLARAVKVLSTGLSPGELPELTVQLQGKVFMRAAQVPAELEQ
jgi:Tfp pilus assembly protein PilO